MRVTWATDRGTDTLTLAPGPDTVWRGRPAQQLRGAFRTAGPDGARVAYPEQQLFVEGIGRVWHRRRYADGTYTSELVEYLSPARLAALRASVPERIAYIDSADVLLHDPDFAWCRPQRELTRDYYNATPDVSVLGGHATLRRVLLPRLDLAALAGESGYLTLRFVVDCRGQIGMIAADEADLDFAPKTFPPEAVAAFAKTLRAGDIAFDLSDAGDHDYYAYLTLKLRDGDVTDFLP